MEITIVIFWIIFCFVVGTVGKKRKIGFAGAFFLSLFLSPLIGLIIAYNSDKKVVVAPPSPVMMKLIREGDKFVKRGNLDEAIEKYESALTYSYNAPITNFKLAKLYSTKEESKKSLRHLEISIEDGFKDFDKIKNDYDLRYLRGTTEYKTFVANGNKIPSVKTETFRSLSRIEELEKLNSLFEKGVLSKEEFESEKKKILSADN